MKFIRNIVIPIALFNATVFYLDLDSFRDILFTSLMFGGMIIRELINDL